jgi:outer membrane receptor protein involved in Fe transport
MTRGVELSLRLRPLGNLDLRAGYTYLDTENRQTGDELLQRPRHSLSLVAGLALPSYGTDLSVSVDYRGERLAETSDGLAELDPYTLVDLSIGQRIARWGRLFVRISNLLGEEDVIDEYDIDGTKVLAGFELRLD